MGNDYDFAMKDILTDLFNSLHKNPDGIVLERSAVEDVYGTNRWYPLISFLKGLEHAKVKFISKDYIKVSLAYLDAYK